ncbi:MAG: 16S rRNA (guanine(527)-N(7))-methyltransferase RsmG [Succinivibrionaceae bacterium]|nr:16S rRNA (guanine(527)-N(7))-methyltransferase RsmG [Succinivibrionaceae bacterium]
MGRTLSNVEVRPGDLLPRLVDLMGQSGIECEQEQLLRLCTLVAMLCKWNQALNLTAVRDPMQMLVLHVMDSAVVSPHLRSEVVADVGTGAGFPGLVLATLNPSRQFTLVDSVAKKLSFVRSAVVELGLGNVTLAQGRCESLRPPEPFGEIVSRAFAPLRRIVEWCLPLLADNGRFLCMKARLEDDEIKDLPLSVKIGGIVRLEVPDLNAERNLVIIQRDTKE